jgi:hypothetical protein
MLGRAEAAVGLKFGLPIPREERFAILAVYAEAIGCVQSWAPSSNCVAALVSRGTAQHF